MFGGGGMLGGGGGGLFGTLLGGGLLGGLLGGSRGFGKAGGMLDCESHGRKKDGTDIWVLEAVTLLKGQNGEPDFMQGTMVDITSRKRAEQVLVKNDEQLRRHNKTLVELSKRKSITLGDVQAALKDITEASATTLESTRASVWFYNQPRTSVR